MMDFFEKIPEEHRKHIEVGRGLSPEEFTEMQLAWYNAKEGKLTGLSCPVCHNSGTVGYLDKAGHMMARQCDCMRARRSRRYMEQSGLAENLGSKTFDNFVCRMPWQKIVKEKAIQYCGAFQGKNPPWLYFSGQSGAGKTHLCTAVCNALMEKGYSLLYRKWYDVFRRMQDFGQWAACEAELKACEVLYLDDFLKSRSPSPKELEVAFSILDDRYTRGKGTILSSEFTLRELYYMDEAIAGRIREKCEGGLFVIQIKKDPQKNNRTE